MKGKTGAEGLNGAFKYGGDAGRYSAQVTNALLGTSPGDLSRLVAGAGRTFGALARHEADLQGLIVNFDTFTGALAAQSTEPLDDGANGSAPTLQIGRKSLVSLNSTLPPLRAWAIEFRPAVAELPGLISAAETVARAGAAAALRQGGRRRRQAAAGIDARARRRGPGGQSEHDPAEQPAQPLHQQGLRADRQRDDRRPLPDRPQLPRVLLLPGQLRRLEPELRRQRATTCGSSPAAATPWSSRKPRQATSRTDKQNWAHTVEPPIGLQPQLGGRPPKKPEVRCSTQPVPDVNGPLGQVGPPSLTAVSP